MKKLFKQYNEWLSLPLAILLLVVSPIIYRLADPTAGSFDLGILQGLLVSLVVLLSGSGFSWLLFKINFPTLYKYWDDKSEQAIIDEPHLRFRQVFLSFAIYFVYMIIYHITVWTLL